MAVSWTACAETAGYLFQSVRQAIHAARSDADVATLIGQTKLTEQLPDAIVEQLETEGAGPQSMRALDALQASSSKLPAPALALKLFEAPPAPSPAQHSAAIDEARAKALQYTASLPDFLCTQIVQRFSGKPAQWKLDDTLQMSVAYTSKGERYKLQAIDGEPTRKTLAQLGGVYSNGEFGSLLQSVFRPEAQTAFTWVRWTMLRGRRAHVFSLRIEQNRSNYKLQWATRLRKYEMFTAVNGFVYLDGATKEVLRIVTDTGAIPSDWPIQGVHGVLDYADKDIGGHRFLLPSHTESTVFQKSGEKRNLSEFTQYRKFAGESNISFEP